MESLDNAIYFFVDLYTRSCDISPWSRWMNRRICQVRHSAFSAEFHYSDAKDSVFHDGFLLCPVDVLPTVLAFSPPARWIGAEDGMRLCACMLSRQREGCSDPLKIRTVFVTSVNIRASCFAPKAGLRKDETSPRVERCSSAIRKHNAKLWELTVLFRGRCCEESVSEMATSARCAALSLPLPGCPTCTLRMSCVFLHTVGYTCGSATGF